VPLTRTGLASVQDSGNLRVVTQPADGTEAGLGMLDVLLKISFRDRAPLTGQRGGRSDDFDCCEKLVQTDPGPVSAVICR